MTAMMVFQNQLDAAERAIPRESGWEDLTHAPGPQVEAKKKM